MSTLKVNTILNAAGTGTPSIDGLAKAWVNFNGTGTVAIRAAFNVSSITDNGTGDYTVNFTTALSDDNYVMTAAGESTAAYPNNVVSVVEKRYNVAPTTTTIRITTSVAAGSRIIQDFAYVMTAFFR